MIYKLYFASHNIITLFHDTIRFSGRNVFITGRDDHGERINFIMDRFEYPNDEPYDYGYCHIVAYIKQGINTPCDIYGAIA